MSAYRCELLGLDEIEGFYRLRIKMLSYGHPHVDYGEYATTSYLKVIDFERGYAVTSSGNIYNWSKS